MVEDQVFCLLINEGRTPFGKLIADELWLIICDEDAEV